MSLKFEMSKTTQLTQKVLLVIIFILFVCCTVHTVTENGDCINVKFEKISTKSSMNAKQFSTTNSGKSNNVHYSYIIRKGTMIEPNLDYMMKGDEKQWAKQKNIFAVNDTGVPLSQFNINRWIAIDNHNKAKKFHNFSGFCAFSLGQRKCPGSAIAMKQLYYFIANLLINFKFTAANGCSNVDIKFQERLTSQLQTEIPIVVQIRDD